MPLPPLSALAAHGPAALSFWLLAAHALRRGDLGQALAWGCLPALFLAPRAWVRRAAQLALGAGIVLWAEAGGAFIRVRQGLDQPWVRLALILAAVIAVAALGIAALESRRAAARGQADPGPAWAPAGAFALCAVLLVTARAKVAFAVLLPDRFLPGSGWLLILVLSIYAAETTRALLLPSLKPRQWSRTRMRLWALFSAVFFGQLALGLAGAERFLMTGKLHLPVPALIAAGPLYRGEGLFMLILFLSTVAVVGPAWCSWLCYIGAWDGLAARSRKRPAPLPRWRGALRAGILVLVLGTAWALRALGAPTGAALALAAGFGLAGVGIMLSLSRGTGTMVHCTTYCPMGLVATTLGRLNPFRVRIGTGCTDCGVCATACRYDSLDAGRIALGRPGPSCTLCGDCVSACPHGAMGYRFPGLSPRISRALFVALVVGAHAAFLGLARI